MELWKKKAVELLAGLALTDAKNPAVQPYTPQKLSVSMPEGNFFRRTSPEKHGIPSARLCAMLREMEANPAVNIHSLLILTEGDVVLDVSAPGYGSHIRHLAHSMSKTVTGLALGFLYDEGKLDLSEKLITYFPEIPYRDKRFPDITVEHLLSMSAGIPFAEAGSVTDSEWTKTFFDTQMKTEAGAEFFYNSMNSYLLARIAERLCGKSFLDYVKEKLFTPLDISDFEWEIGVEGVVKGGWGLYLSAESWAKLGDLVLNGGTFRGVRLLSEEWIARMTSPHSVTKADTGDFNYGYQIWVERDGDEILFNGMLGQNVWISPKNKIVAVITAGNNELFSRSPSLDILRSYLKEARIPYGDDAKAGEKELAAAEKNFFVRRHWLRPKTPNRGLSVLLGFRKKKPFDEQITPLLGTWKFRSNNDGILPLFVRLMQNNYAGGIRSFTFSRLGDRLYFESEEETQTFRMEVGLYGFAETVLDFGGEKYIARAMMEAMEDVDRNLVYKFEIVFPEMPNTRFFRLSFGADGTLLVSMSENPNQRIAECYLASVKPSGKLGALMDLVSRRLTPDAITAKFTAMFNPTFICVKADDPRAEQILQREETLRSLTLGENRLVLSFVRKFTAEDGAPQESKNPLSGFLSLFGFGKRRDTSDTAVTAEDVVEVLPAPEEDVPSQNG